MFYKRVLRMTVSACAVFATACSDPISPEAVVGTYALQGVAGDPLPAHLFSNEHVSVRVLSETIHFDANGRGSVNTVREIQYLSGSASESINGDWAFGYKIIDQRIEVAYDCPDLALCVPPPHLILRLTPDGMNANFTLEGRTPMAYARLP